MDRELREVMEHEGASMNEQIDNFEVFQDHIVEI